MAAGGHRPDVDARGRRRGRPSGPGRPSSAPPENGEDGSIASTPTRRPASPQRRDQGVGRRGLADPGRAGDARRPGRGRCAGPARRSPRAARRLVLDQGDQPGDGARASPPRARLDEVGDRRPAARGAAASGRSSAGSGLRDTDDQGVALAAAAAQRSRTDAAAATLQLEREVQDDAGAGHADRVAERDGAAVDVDLVVGEAELAGRGDADGGEGLVELDQVEVGGRDALLLAGLRGGVGRLQLQRGVGPGDLAVGADLGEPGRGRAPRPWPCSSRRPRGAVGDLRGRAGGDGAVLGEGGAQLGEGLGGGVAADALVLGDDDRVALALRDRRPGRPRRRRRRSSRRRRPSGATARRTRPAPRGSGSGAAALHSSVSSAHRLRGELVEQARRRPSSRRAWCRRTW